MCLYHRAILRRGARRNDPSLALHCACGLGDRRWPFDVHYSDQSLGRRVSKATLEVVGGVRRPDVADCPCLSLLRAMGLPRRDDCRDGEWRIERFPAVRPPDCQKEPRGRGWAHPSKSAEADAHATEQINPRS